MPWYGYGPHMWGAVPPFPFFFLMPLFGLLWLGLLILGVYFVVRAVRNQGRPGSRAREILEERFARGELSSQEYHERLQQLS
jgi:putative membrane protein